MSNPSNDLPSQRSTRAPAEGAEQDEQGNPEAGYDQTAADAGAAQAAERSPREPAEGSAASGGSPERSRDGSGRPEQAGSGNTLGDGRTAGGGGNASKRDVIEDSD